jgi:hypothetical protein
MPILDIVISNNIVSKRNLNLQNQKAMSNSIKVSPLAIVIIAFLSCLAGYYLATPRNQLQSVVFVTQTNDTLALDYVTPYEIDSLQNAGAEIILKQDAQ